MSVAGVVLAAGFSRRLGRPKQHVVVRGETLLARTVRVAREAELSPLFVVVNQLFETPDAVDLSPAMLLRNRSAEEGIASSIRMGIHALEEHLSLEGVVLMTCDQAGISQAHLRALCAERDRLTGSGYAGKVAVPAYVPRSCWGELLSLQGDTGARSLLRDACAVPCEDLSIDVDTEEDVVRAQRMFG